MASFNEQVIALIKTIPKGQVMSYGQIAACLGRPRAAREVGWALRSTGGGLPGGGAGQAAVPWWRVINRDGKISIKGNFEATAELQKQLLENEGITVDKDYSLDIARHRFQPERIT